MVYTRQTSGGVGAGIAGGGGGGEEARRLCTPLDVILVSMGPQNHLAAAAAAGTCACSCLCCGPASLPSDNWLRSLKRKMDEIAVNEGVARVEIEDESAALREALGSHQKSIGELQAELEEERSAAASAAMEAMSMILRLQREKAEAQMEARQFKRFAEEKMAHDQQEIAALEELLFKRDQAILALSCEIDAYRHRLLSCGISIPNAYPSEPMTPDMATTASARAQFDFSCYDYPSLRCTTPTDDASVDLEKYPFGETPHEQLQKLEQRISQLERMPSSDHLNNVMEKRVVVGHSPQRAIHIRRFSVDSHGSGLEFNKGEEFPVTVDRASDCDGRDDMSDRIYTVDTIHWAAEDYVSMQREIQNRKDLNGSDEEVEIKRLYMRLEALEADRESMRQSLISLGTDKTQVVLMKEIAQQLYKDVASERRIVKKQSFLKKFSIISMVKCVMSFVFQRNKSSRIKYNFGLSANIVGLLIILDQSARMRHQRFLTRDNFQFFLHNMSCFPKA